VLLTAKRKSRHDFPTPESPIRSSCKEKSQEMVRIGCTGGRTREMLIIMASYFEEVIVFGVRHRDICFTSLQLQNPKVVVFNSVWLGLLCYG